MLAFYLGLIDTQEEKDKFEQLYHQYSRLMFYVAKAILHDDFLAEDAVHNAFIKIMRHLDKIDENSCHKTKSFMVIVVERVSIDIYNKQKREPGISMEDFGGDILDDGDLEEDVVQQVSVEHVVKRIGKLPGVLKEVLLLKYLHEMSDREIADVLDISPAAARKRIERARQRISILCNGGRQ